MKRCIAAGLGAGPCDSARQRHHWIKQQAIRRAHRTLAAEKRRGGPGPSWRLGVALRDRRLWSWVCWRHHKPIEEGRLRPALPEGFWDAVAEYGLEADLPRWLRGVR